jgi:outer membrane protein OmpA-like peptidoglycan-associated protein
MVEKHEASSCAITQPKISSMDVLHAQPAQFVDVVSGLGHSRAENNIGSSVMQRMRCCLGLAALLLLPNITFSGGVAAQTRPAYTADQIVNRFSGAAEALGSSRGLGGARAVCAGTEADCRKQIPGVQPITSVNTPSFDLMIQFGLDSDRLTDGARRNLDEFAAALQDPRLKIVNFAVEGHTDGRGSDGHNLDLSRRRAEAVARYLESRGIERERVQPRAYGSARPRTGDSLDPVNRRVETRIAQ